MGALVALPISIDQIKLRWEEPYVSAALNHKNFKTMPRGIYRGFIISPMGGKNIRIDTESASGYPSGYLGGNFDAAIAAQWSVAVHESIEGFGVTVLMQRGVDSTYDFDLTAYSGGVVYAALSVNYLLGYASTGSVGIYDAAGMDADPTLLCIGKVEVPASADITSSNIIYNDALYPRILPYANIFHGGFMSAEQANLVEILKVPGASNAYEHEVTLSTDGEQEVIIPSGDVYVVGGHDLLVFRNGRYLTRGRDYSEIDRGDGKGEKIQLLMDAQTDDRILFRGQEYAVALTNTLTVKDEYSAVAQNVTSLNFQGSGVLVLPDGTGQVRIIIPELSGAGNSSSRLKKNATGALIPRGRAVHLTPTGIVPCDPRIASHRVFGVTEGPVSPGEFGTIIVGGSVNNGLLGLGGYGVGDKLYVTHSGDGDLAITPPNPLDGAVFQVGYADCPVGTDSVTATDIVLQIQRII